MKTSQWLWEESTGWQSQHSAKTLSANLVLFFGSRQVLMDPKRYEEIEVLFPNAIKLGCSTAGEIIDEEVLDDSICLNAIEFEKTPIRLGTLNISSTELSPVEAGQKIGQELQNEDLKALFVLSDGQMVNGSELVEGLTQVVGPEVIITGGLAGDGGAFEKTLLSANMPPVEGQIAVLGLYGEHIRIGHGSVGGWDTFGPLRTITQSAGNVLYELDEKPALELYKQYLGEQATALPGSALLFPLQINEPGKSGHGTVRTILNVSELSQSMTFAGDIPQGYEAQLMMANFENLIEGASEAANHANLLAFQQHPEQEALAILISCVGRKMVLGQRTADEVEAVREVLGENIQQLGFYSYGEISPHVSLGNCQLHNQTMTITVWQEI